ncbi:MAG: tRNA (adenosine(37)-N6)-threonylcarbamoyltransferase complex ATPase subunit type 1 TsaE [Nitrospiria bacterium]
MPKRGLNIAISDLTLSSRGKEETFQLGKSFGKAAIGGEVIALLGPLGAGKTLFVRGLAEGLEVRDSHINSPTYTLLHHHEGRLPLTHVDLYRLNNASEIDTIGLDDYLEGSGVVAIEWADKGFLQDHHACLTVTIHFIEGDQREISLRATGAHHMRWLEALERTGDRNKLQGNG